MGNLTVSVILTTHFRNEGLRKAIRQVLAQEYDDIEILIFDDSGEGYAEEVVDEYGSIEYIPHSSNRGQIAGWNTGMQYASGEYIQFHDDDDWLFEDKIRKQIRLLEDNPSVGSVYCGIVDQNGTEQLPRESNRGDVVEPALRQRLHQCQTTTMLTRRDVLEEVFPLKPYPAATDIALQLELCTRTEFDYINEPLVYRTMNNDGRSSSVVNRQTSIQLVHDYSSLYDEYPRLRDETLARTHKMLGKKILEERLWSLAAISSFAKANYYTPKAKTSDSIDYLLYLFASGFGQPGLSVYDGARPYLARMKEVV